MGTYYFDSNATAENSVPGITLTKPAGTPSGTFLNLTADKKTVASVKLMSGPYGWFEFRNIGSNIGDIAFYNNEGKGGSVIHMTVDKIDNPQIRLKGTVIVDDLQVQNLEVKNSLSFKCGGKK